MSKDPTDQTAGLAEFLLDIGRQGLPGPVAETAADLLLDHLAVSLQGVPLPWSATVREYALAQDAGPRALVYGGGRSSAALAALANGTAAHGIELDDTHDPSCTHPGAVVFSAALAVAQAEGASGGELLRAAAAGYEAMGRVGAALGGDLMKNGFHPTAMAGIYGACTAAAVLLKVDRDTLLDAWGLALSMTSGSMQFTEDSQRTMVKRLHGGWPAHSGIVAVELARRGLNGPRGALEGKFGIMSLYSPRPDAPCLTQGLGTQWVMQQISIKRYACCRLFHALIDAVVESREREGWAASEVEAVEAFGPVMMSRGHMDYRPESVMAAQYSLPYTMAVALLGDPKAPASFSEDSMRQAATLAMADRVGARVDDALEGRYPAKFAGGFTATLKGGRTVTHQLIDSVGTPEKPMSRDDIIGKYQSLTADVMTQAQQAALRDIVLDIGRSPGLDALTGALEALWKPGR